MLLSVLLAALLIEQILPLPYARWVRSPAFRGIRRLKRWVNAGDRHSGVLAGLIAVGAPTLLAWTAYAGLYALSPALAWLWSVAVLYLALGFGNYSRRYTDIQLALRFDDLPQARRLLAAWRGPGGNAGEDDKGLNAAAIARRAMTQALAASHRHLFGVLVGFVLLPGPCGAVLYRAAALYAEYWAPRAAHAEGFSAFAQRVFRLIDTVPARVTAIGFAIAGNFEDALFGWRTHAASPQTPLAIDSGIVLASGFGALGRRFNESESETAAAPPSPRAAKEDSADRMQAVVDLTWRTLLLWLLLLLLFNAARFVGK